MKIFSVRHFVLLCDFSSKILNEKGELDPLELDLLLRNPQETHVGSPVDFLNEKTWGNIKALSLVPTFHGLDRDIETSSKRWKTFVESEAPEYEKPPVNFIEETKKKSNEIVESFFRANGKVKLLCNNFAFFEPFVLIE